MAMQVQLRALVGMATVTESVSSRVTVIFPFSNLTTILWETEVVWFAPLGNHPVVAPYTTTLPCSGLNDIVIPRVCAALIMGLICTELEAVGESWIWTCVRIAPAS